MKKTLSVLLALLIISVTCLVGCESNAAEKEEAITSVSTETVSVSKEKSVVIEETATETEKNSVEKEVEEWMNVKQSMIDEAYKLISKVEEKDTMDPDLFKEIIELQDEFDKYREMSKRQLSAEAYDELFYYLSDEGYWQPLTYANNSFYLPSEYYVNACWADNVIIPENNNSYETDRVYTLKDNKKCGYLLLYPKETKKRLVVIEPGVSYIHKFSV